MAIDVITVGNLLIDLLVTIPDDNPYCRVNTSFHEFCVKAGEKILADHVGFVLGGGAGRVAIGLRRLGLQTAVFADIGTDELAVRIQKTLQEEGVITEMLNQVEKETSFTVGINFQSERTLFVHHIESKHRFDFSTVRARWVYLASLGSPWEDTYRAVVSYKRESGAKLACNPGQSQFVKGRASYLPTLANADILFVNKQEAQIITDTKVDDMKVLLEKIKALGVGIGVITDGRNGSCAIDSDGACFSIGIVPSAVVERTGAGDAYAAGFLSAIMDGESVQNAMVWGTLNASSVVTELGGLAGLLTKGKLKASLQRQREALRVRVL